MSGKWFRKHPGKSLAQRSAEGTMGSPEAGQWGCPKHGKDSQLRGMGKRWCGECGFTKTDNTSSLPV